MKAVNKILNYYRNISIVAKATLWFIICSILQKSISLITTPIFTRMMSTEQYGQFSIYNSWLQIFTILTTLRLNGAVFNKGMSLYKDDRETYTSTMQMVSFGLAAICLVVYFVFRDYLNALTEFPTFIMVAIFAELAFSPAIDYWTVRKRYEYQYIPVVIRTLIMAGLNAVFGVIGVYFASEKGYARILTCVLVNLIFGIILFSSNLKSAKTWFKKEYAKFAVLFNIPLLLHYFSQYVLDQFDRIMVQKLVNNAAAGIYSVAYSVGLILRIVTTSINNALVPWQYEKLEKKEYKQLDDVMFSVFCVVAACCFLLACTAPEIMHILASDVYYEGVYVIPPVALGLFFSFVYTLYANVEFYFNANKFSMYISMGSAICNVVLNYFGIRMFGYIAAAYTTLICYALFALGHYLYTAYCMKRADSSAEVFKWVRLFILSAIVVLGGILISLTYSSIIFRYGIVLAIALFLFINRKGLLRVFASIRKNKLV